MAHADYIFNYLRDCYDLMPAADRARIANVWRAYEQVLGDLYTKTIEYEFNIATPRLLAFNNQRWNSFIFNPSTAIIRPAQFVSPADLTGGINLSAQYLLNISVDEDPPIEVNVQGANPLKTTGQEIADKLNAAFGFKFATINSSGKTVLTTQTTGPAAKITFWPTSIPTASAVEFIFGIDPENTPDIYPKYPYVYNLKDKYIQRIPSLVDHILEDKVDVTLVEIADYVVEVGAGIITFNKEPEVKMWAKNTLVNQEVPYNNFGFLMDFYDVNSEQYLQTLQGLWFAFWSGPKPLNIRKALYLLFGLASARTSGTVKSVSPTLITYREDGDDGEIDGGQLISIDVPSGLVPVVTKGQRLSKFDFFYTGINVIDQVNKPGFVEEDIGRTGIQFFLTEDASTGVSEETDESKALKTVERNLYLAQVLSDAFISNTVNIGNVKGFLRDISPKHKTFLFQILVQVDDTVTTDDSIGLSVNFDVTPNVDYNPWLEADPDVLNPGEITAGEELGLDSEVFGHAEESSIEVYHDASTSPVLVDSFEF